MLGLPDTLTRTEAIGVWIAISLVIILAIVLPIVLVETNNQSNPPTPPLPPAVTFNCMQ